MPSPKSLNRWGVAVKIESTEGTYSAPSPTTDGFLVVERPDVTTDWMHDGRRVHPTLKNLPRTGRGHTLTLVHEPAGAGAAYNGTTQVASIRNIARLCGLNVAVDTTVGSEKETYTPSANGYASGSAVVYVRGQEYHITALHGNFKFEAENGGIPRFTVDANGISDALPADQPSIPAITYPSVDPAVASNMSLSLGAWNPARIKSIVLAQELAWNPRYLDNTGKHGGFNPGAEPSYTLEAIVEAEALSNYNPYQVAELATSAALSATFGTGTTYRKYQLAAPNCQLVELPEQDEENAALWGLKFELKPTTFMGTDHFSWAFVK